MARSTGPILAAGAITLGNRVVLHQQPVDWRVPVATGMLAAALAFGERAAPTVVVAVAWTILATVVLTRVDPKTPSPAESVLQWWNEG